MLDEGEMLFNYARFSAGTSSLGIIVLGGLDGRVFDNCPGNRSAKDGDGFLCAEELADQLSSRELSDRQRATRNERSKGLRLL